MSSTKVDIQDNGTIREGDSWERHVIDALRGTPKKPFDPRQGVGERWSSPPRYGGLDIDGNIFNSGYADPAKSSPQGPSLGFANYDRTDFQDGAAGGGNRRSEGAILFHAQVSF
jgi:hypothetical protein